MPELKSAFIGELKIAVTGSGAAGSTYWEPASSTARVSARRCCRVELTSCSAVATARFVRTSA